MTDTAAPDLLPCPFCGGTNVKSGGDDKIVGVWCPDCQASGGMAFDDRTPCILEPGGARIATPLEWERAMGFPDNHTAVQYRGKLAADGPRYKSLGNSMAVPVIRWIMDRIKISMEGVK